MYDIAIIGSGPAGLSAGINAVQCNKTAVIIGGEIKDIPLYKAECVDNYLGQNSVSGKELLESFYSHAIAKGIEIIHKTVLQICDLDDYFSILAGEDVFEAKAVILAIGKTTDKAIVGESELLGRGVSYCTACDGQLYRNKRLAVIGEGEKAFEAVNYLCEIADSVSLISVGEAYDKLPEKVEIIKEKPIAVLGDKKVSGVKFADIDLSFDGVFIIKNAVSPTVLIQGIATEKGYIVVDESYETSVKNIYAIGDCIGGTLQISKAVSDGLIAAQNISRRLNRRN